ncbi:hypothetical protein [Streptomyces qaidamensis]|uniref:hypothetical protein n=1 Tax=Streptomyces qaidamensis TaxID=1783515 RepID=UPI000ABE07F4|nr:hypothetical protein [Streptomyces qaidamensis]
MAAPFRSYADRTLTEVLTDLTEDAELRAALSSHYGDYSLAPGRTSFGIHAMLIRH